MGHSWLETSIMWRRLPPALDEGVRWRWYLASTTFPVPPVESDTINLVACLQYIVVHRKATKQFQKRAEGQNIEDILG